MDTLIDAFDLDALESAATTAAGGGPRLAIPFLVQGYDTSDMDPIRHYMVVLRMDGGGDGVTPLKLFLSANDPTANKNDPNARRPPISAFEFPAYAKAIRDNDFNALRNLGTDGRVKTFTNIGGLVLGDGLVQVEGGFEARWIQPLQEDEHDTKHRVLLGWANVVLRPNTPRTFDVQYLKAADSVVTSNVDELHAALRRAFADEEFGRPGAFLRVLQKDLETGHYKVAMVVGAATPNGGRIDRRDKPVNGGAWQMQTIEEAVAAFRGQPAGKMLATQAWGDKVVEVMPVITIGIGPKTIEEAVKKKRSMPDVPYIIPPDTGISGASNPIGTPGFANSTVRLTAIFDEGNPAKPKGHVAGLAKPMTGELYALRDISTPSCTPEASPAFPVYPKSEKPAAAPKVDLEGAFPV